MKEITLETANSPGSKSHLSEFKIQPTVQYLPGGVLRRFAATIIDGIIITLITTPLLFGLTYFLGLAAGGASSAAFISLTVALTYLLQLVAIIYYYGYFYSKKGASPGKKLLGLRICNDETGLHLTFMQSALRETIFKLISGIIFAIGFLMAAFRSDKRALHDLLANSKVVLRN